MPPDSRKFFDGRSRDLSCASQFDPTVEAKPHEETSFCVRTCACAGLYSDRAIHGIRHNRTLTDGVRVLYRSRHIYLLFNALINITLGLYVLYAPSGWRRSLQITGSVLIIVAPAFLLVGFFYEPPRGANQTIVAPYGIFATAIGMLLHLVGAIRRG